MYGMHLKVKSFAVNRVLGPRVEVELDTEKALGAPKVVGGVAGGEVPVICLNTGTSNVIFYVHRTFILGPFNFSGRCLPGILHDIFIVFLKIVYAG